MNYKKRLLETKLKNLATHFPVITLTGARQVGKTTLLQHILNEIHPLTALTAENGKILTTENGAALRVEQQTHFTFDPTIDIGNARQDPELFLNHVGTPVLLDEIQYAPELLSAIKRRIDQKPQAGQYWLTGSQNLNLLKNVAESLAGRAAVMSLYPMSLGEMYDRPTTWLVDFLQQPKEFIGKPHPRIFIDKQPVSLYSILWRGCYPGLIDADNEILQVGLDSYLHTYLERDVRVLSEISDLHEFSRFVQLLAHRTAQEINFSELGREIGITPQTAKRWLNILISTFQWQELPPFSNNLDKRLSSKSKGYFVDSGLAAHLMHISSPTALAGHPQLGALFETFVVQDILKQINTMAVKPAIYQWRKHSGAEVDLILEIDNRYFPIEIKCTSRPGRNDCRGIKAFREDLRHQHLQIEDGLVIAPVTEIFPLAKNCYAVPFDLY